MRQIQLQRVALDQDAPLGQSHCEDMEAHPLQSPALRACLILHCCRFRPLQVLTMKLSLRPDTRYRSDCENQHDHTQKKKNQNREREVPTSCRLFIEQNVLVIRAHPRLTPGWRHQLHGRLQALKANDMTAQGNALGTMSRKTVQP